MENFDEKLFKNISEIFPEKEEEKELSIDEKLQRAISEVFPEKEETVDDYLTIEEKLQKAMLKADMYSDEKEKTRVADELDKQEARIKLALIVKKCKEFEEGTN